ncbi:MAG: Inositol 2-dehydrogenase [Paenibacillus sp.]|jgi:predicted dehydrogenase|nr:Inositol 2-dehydrogenase [Paenibacillus sp.]
MRKINTAVVGTGFIGQVHIEAIRRLSGIEVKALVASSEEKAEALAKDLAVPEYYGSFDAMLEDPSIECVHICTPNYLHYAMARDAMLAGKHVVCEKPLTLTRAQAEELVALAHERGLVHAICFNMRYYPLMQQMRVMIRNGDMGDIYSINGSYFQDWLIYESDYNWRVDSAKSGSSRAVADIGSHWMDLAETVSGLSITEVMADFATFLPSRRKPVQTQETFAGKLNPNHAEEVEYETIPIDTEDYANVMFRFENGARGSLTVSQVHAGRKNKLMLEIAGSEQAASWSSERPNELWLGRRDSSNSLQMKDPSLVYPESSKFMDYPGGHTEGYPDTFKQLFKEVYDAIAAEERSNAPAYPTFESGLREQVLCDKIIESHESKKWVNV